MSFAEIEIIHRVLKNEPTSNTQTTRRLVVTLVGIASGYRLGYRFWLLLGEVHTRRNLIAFTGFQVAEL